MGFLVKYKNGTSLPYHMLTEELGLKQLTPNKGETKGIKLPLMEAMLVGREGQSQLVEEVHDHPNKKLRFKGTF